MTDAKTEVRANIRCIDRKQARKATGKVDDVLSSINTEIIHEIKQLIIAADIVGDDLQGYTRTTEIKASEKNKRSKLEK